MLKVLIVEDEPLLANTLKQLIELNPLYEVTGLADDLPSAIAAAEERRPDLALVDLQLARGSTGFSVAVKLGEAGIPCLFATGKAPAFPMPDLALGCLMKPYSQEDIVRSLKTAEDILRGRERLRPSRPENLTLYTEVREAPPAAELPEAPPLQALKSRVAGWWGR